MLRYTIDRFLVSAPGLVD